MTDGFRETGESSITARLRTQEEIHQKASAALSDEVSTFSQANHTHPSHIIYPVVPSHPS